MFRTTLIPFNPFIAEWKEKSYSSVEEFIVAQMVLKMKKIRKVQIHNSKIKEGR